MISDLPRCYSLYPSDLSDALNLQFLSSLILIYFATLTIASTFSTFLSGTMQGAMVGVAYIV